MTTQPAAATPETAWVPVPALAPADTPRSGEVDMAHVRALMAERDLPPLLVCRRTMRVVDGMHRLTAAILAGRTTVEVRWFDGDDEAAFVRAVQENLHHGLRLRTEERTAAARRIMEAYPQWSNRAIAQAAGLSAKTVAAVRGRATEDGPRLATRVGRDGRARPVDPAAGRARAAAYLREHPDASLRRIAAATGVSSGTARDVRTRLRAGEDPVARRAGGGPPADGPTPWVLPDRARRRAPAGDALAVLARDPALRLSETGRQLLRLLDNRVLAGSAAAAALRAAVPEHNRAAVAAAVNQHIELWLAFVNAVELAG
ncbi:ParB N-terminal domain-containing protein [Kitasatospora sp. NPDC059571]|uniref:ParB/RepB/Spo0J family partition protein n=1 Tax=Kitasatospora sp. NPDC059571 TaxID=3346871 RepID=UPI0036AC9339